MRCGFAPHMFFYSRTETIRSPLTYLHTHQLTCRWFKINKDNQQLIYLFCLHVKTPTAGIEQTTNHLIYGCSATRQIKVCLINHSYTSGTRQPTTRILLRVLSSSPDNKFFADIFEDCVISVETGLVGIEPTNAAVKLLCLAAWRQPYAVSG